MMNKKYAELITKFTQGLASESEDKELLNLMGETIIDDVGYEEFSQSIWEKGKNNIISDERKAHMKKEILNRISQYDNTGRNFRHKVYRFILKATTVAAVIVLAVFLGYRLYENNINRKYELVCEHGQKSVFVLPDSTLVHLNSSSKLNYTSLYNTIERNVELLGEAYFDVAKNKDVPFIVKTGNMQVKVLGTKFNVKAYEEDNDIEVTLVEGKIAAFIDGKKEILMPKERLKYNKFTGKMSKTVVADEINWKDGRMVFRDVPMKKVLNILERYYNVSFRILNVKILNSVITAKFNNEQLFQILEYLKIANGLEYEILEPSINSNGTSSETIIEIK